jgi:hypothetical protein
MGYSSMKCCRKFRRKYPESVVLCKATICKKITFYGTDAGQKDISRRHSLTKEKLDDIRSQLIASLRKSLFLDSSM